MGKGILLEMAGRQAVVLTPQGEFKKVPVPGGTWEIGDEIEYAEPGNRSLWTRWASTAAAAAVLLIGSWVGYDQYSLAQPVAVMTVDINPSLELTLNKADQVLKAEAKNADGSLVLQGVEYKRKPLAEVLVALTDRAVAVQKLNPADESSAVLVGVAPVQANALPTAQAERVVETARAAVTAEVAKVARAQGQEAKTNVAVLVATGAEKREAEKEGLSVGKFKLLPEVQAVAPEVTPEQFKQTGPGKLLHDLHINPSEIFSKAQQKNEKAKGQQAEPPKQPVNGTVKPGDAPGKGGVQEPPKKSDEKRPDDKKADDKKGDDKKPDEKKHSGGALQDLLPGAPLGPKPDAPKQDEPKKDEPKKDESKREEPKKDEPKQVESKKDEPKKDESKKDESRKDESKKDEPKQAEPKKNESKEDTGKKDSWTIPWLGITIPKPDFLRDHTEPQAAESPRATAPGVGAQPNSGADKEAPKASEPKIEKPTADQTKEKAKDAAEKAKEAAEKAKEAEKAKREEANKQKDKKD